MKTSNKIIVSFLTFAWLTIMASLLVSHQFADYNNIPGKRRVIKTETDLADFSVVKIEQAGTLIISSLPRNRLRYERLVGEGIAIPETDPIEDYVVRNDTLFVKNLRQASDGNFLLEVKNLKHLIVNNTNQIHLSGFDQDLLLITTTNSKVAISQKSSFSYLNVSSPEKINLSFTSASDFSLVVDEVKVKVSGDIKGMSGTIGDNIELIVPSEVGKMDVNTAKNSKITYAQESDVKPQ
ncbi:hypothetical protein U3A58_11095 [Algoriphagus sp. C2-6-M1]|uniref:hypothetical protein n=1 Tax=Algoriphagus persicinus TaxID=3108754 RepID=UPI002B3FAB22|nr:hypothetical protein [Algoriphagus sp. C2-6-M1]MEB2780940.1 hypothetical protein [Algoriphagus sp. C2-6-M1]